MRKGTLVIAGAVGLGIVLVAPDAWATTGFQTVDQGINRLLTAVMGAAGTGGIIETVTGWRFGHGGVMQSGAKTGVMGAGIGGAGAISTTVLGSGTSFAGEMLPHALPWFHPLLALLQ